MSNSVEKRPQNVIIFKEEEEEDMLFLIHRTKQ